MKKQFGVLSIALLIAFVTSAQQFITKEGKIHFFSATAMENIEATSKQAVCALNTGTGKVFCKVVMTSFHFPSKFMEEHFNENYMESDKFPKSSFKGKVLGYDASKAGSYEVEGDMTIHGVTKKVKTKMTLSNVGGKLVVSGNFSVKLQDYDIKIPSMVKNKLSDTVKIAVKLELENK